MTSRSPGATPAASPPPALVAACAKVCRSKLRQAGIRTPRSHPEILQLYRDLRGQDLAQLAAAEEKLELLEAEQRADPHVRFRYGHDLTGCWNRSAIRTRYHAATLDNPRGHRSSWSKPRSVKGILHEVCQELGEDFKTFTRRVCQAVHERSNRIAELRRTVYDLQERMVEGRLLARG